MRQEIGDLEGKIEEQRTKSAEKDREMKMLQSQHGSRPQFPALALTGDFGSLKRDFEGFKQEVAEIDIEAQPSHSQNREASVQMEGSRTQKRPRTESNLERSSDIILIRVIKGRPIKQVSHRHPLLANYPMS